LRHRPTTYRLHILIIAILVLFLTSCGGSEEVSEEITPAPEIEATELPRDISGEALEPEETAETTEIVRRTQRLTLDIEIDMKLIVSEEAYNIEFVPNIALHGFEWFEIGQYEAEEPWRHTRFYVQEMLHQPDDFSPQTPFSTTLNHIDEFRPTHITERNVYPTHGLSFKDENGMMRQFVFYAARFFEDDHDISVIQFLLFEFNPPRDLPTVEWINGNDRLWFVRADDEFFEELGPHHLATFYDEHFVSDMIALITDTPLRDFRWVAYENWFEQPEHAAKVTTLFALEELTPDMPFVFTYRGLGAPAHRGMSFVDESGETRYFGFMHNHSGELINGFFSLMEFMPGDEADTIAVSWWPDE